MESMFSSFCFMQNYFFASGHRRCDGNRPNTLSTQHALKWEISVQIRAGALLFATRLFGFCNIARAAIYTETTTLIIRLCTDLTKLALSPTLANFSHMLHTGDKTSYGFIAEHNHTQDHACNSSPKTIENH